MRDPLALYTAVMGRLWEEERIRGQRQARIEARIAGRRQGRSYRRAGRASARNMLKAASQGKPCRGLQADQGRGVQDPCVASVTSWPT